MPDKSTNLKYNNEKNENDIKILKNANEISKQFNDFVGYRIKLYQLKYKSPPTLIVKAIERLRWV